MQSTLQLPFAGLLPSLLEMLRSALAARRDVTRTNAALRLYAEIARTYQAATSVLAVVYEQPHVAPHARDTLQITVASTRDVEQLAEELRPAMSDCRDLGPETNGLALVALGELEGALAAMHALCEQMEDIMDAELLADEAADADRSSIPLSELKASLGLK